ncbi:hypothetical protein MTBSS4_230036 [Magnetospirillum sp. SS-4]|nr:hypothetical protein MTBSS4_230036 [Magnetospirillum sp. SS-4]
MAPSTNGLSHDGLFNIKRMFFL